MISYDLNGGEFCVHLSLRCCQPCFINEVIGVGEGHKDCQGQIIQARGRQVGPLGICGRPRKGPLGVKWEVQKYKGGQMAGAECEAKGL